MHTASNRCHQAISLHATNGADESTPSTERCAIDPRQAQPSAARALLGAQHPLVRVMDDIRARVKQAMVLMGIIAASATAVLAGVAEARAVLAAAIGG